MIKYWVIADKSKFHLDHFVTYSLTRYTKLLVLVLDPEKDELNILKRAPGIFATL